MAKKADTAQSVSYRLNVRRAVDDEIIVFDFTAFDSKGIKYVYSVRDFDADTTLMKPIMDKIAKTWPDEDGFKMCYEELKKGVRKITEIL
jgi:hypothetical protein